MRNLDMTQDGNVSKRLPVPAWATPGDVVPIGADGMIGALITERMTTAKLNDVDSNTTLAHGLKDGEATVELPGCALVLNLQVSVATAIGDAIYVATGGGYSKTNTGTFLGFALAAQASAGIVPVALYGPR